MTTQYTTILKLALPVQGELSGTWGDVVNDNITQMVEQAVAGKAVINTWTGNSHTLTTADGTTSESRCAILELTDSGTALTGAGTVVCPTNTKLYIVDNNTAEIVTVKTSAGTGVAVPVGKTMLVYCDGTNVVEGVTHANSLSLGTSTVTADKILDEDNMASDSATAIATQQSIKAYVDSQVGTVDTLSEILANGNTTGANDIDVDSAQKVQFRDAAIYLNSSVDGQLDIVADGEVQIDTALVDINGNLDVSGTTNISGSVSFTKNAIAGVAISTTSRSSNTVTVTTSAVHGLTSGDLVNVNGVADTSFNGYFTVSVSSTTVFTYNQTGADGSSTGGTSTEVVYNLNASGTALNWMNGPLNIAANSGIDGLEITQSGAGNGLHVTGTTGLVGNVNVTGTVTADGLTIDGTTATIQDDSANLRFENSAGTRTGYIQNRADAFEIWDDQATPMTFGTSNTERMRIDASGNLLVSDTTANPSGDNVDSGIALHSGGLVRASTNNAAAPLDLNIKGRNGYIAVFRKDGSTVGSIGTYSGALDVAGSTRGLRITDGSVFPVTNAGSVSDNYVNLGYSGGRFKDLYLSGTVALTTADNASAANIFVSPSTDFLYLEHPANGMIFRNTSGSERMRIDANGTIKSSVNGAVANLILENDADTPYMLFTESGAAQFFIGESSIVGGGAGYYDLYAVTGLGQRFFTNSLERMRIDASGNVGIGVVPESYQALYRALQVGNTALIGRHSGGTSETYLTANSYYDGAWKYIVSDEASVISQSAGVISFLNAASGIADATIGWSEAMRIDASGNVGIGVSSLSGVKMDVLATASDNLVARFENNHATGSYGISVKAGDDSGNYAADFANKSGTSLMRIRGDGNVGIGTSSPSSVLSVKSDINNNVNNGILFEAADSTNKLLRLYENSVGECYMGFHQADVQTALIRTNGPSYFNGGDVGIGQDTPKTTLNLGANNSGQGAILTLENTDTSITTNDVIGQIDFYANDGSTNGTGAKVNIKAIATSTAGTVTALTFGTSDSASATAVEAMRLDASGNLLVGTTSQIDVGKVCIDAGTDSNGLVVDVDDATGYTNLLLDRTASDGTFISFNRGATNVGSIMSRAGLITTIILDPRSGQGAGLTGAGAGGDTLRHITPTNESGVEVNGKVSLGNASNAFKDLYLSGGVVFGDAGGSGSSSSNTLDSYEEGTWTPTLISIGYTFAYSTQAGIYTKIGNMVSVKLYLRLSGAPTGSGVNVLRIGSLPFTSVGGNASYSAGSILVENSDNLFAGVPAIRSNPSVTYLSIYDAIAGSSPASTFDCSKLDSNDEFEVSIVYHTA